MDAMTSDSPPPPGSLPPAPPTAPWTGVDSREQPPYLPSPYPPPPTTNVLAIVGFAGAFFNSLVGIVCGHIALAQIRRTGEQGRGLALAAVIIGYAQLALVFFASVFVAVVFALGGFAAALSAYGTGTQSGSSTAAECATVTRAAGDVSSVLSSIENSSWQNAPAAAKAQVVDASNRFNDATYNISDHGLSAGVNTEEGDLTSLGSALVDYEAAEPGQGDEARVTAALTKASDDLDALTSSCR